ncbi:hypothetical protein VTI74DRAFT_1531 [Chaetomium olivicolor]
MVSFFGLKFGDKKKKSENKSAQSKQQHQQHQWKRIDQNALGEGQFFGKNINQKGVINGSIRSVSRAGTPQPSASGRSPYANSDTHNLAAASMFNLSNAGPMRPGSQTSLHLKPHASDANLRTRFGAHNGSSASLALPAPGFASRLAARNGSSTSLAPPSPLGSRPGTPNRSKPWVNPLDVHFMRSVPSGPPSPKSPLVSAPLTLPPTPITEKAETGSVFGEDANDMVDAVMASVRKREQEEKEAKEKEKELEKQRETARLEMERLERQKSTESNLTRPGSAPRSQPESPLKHAVEQSLPTLMSKGDTEARPGSRGGPNGQVRPPPLHQGPPPTGPPTQCLPQPPGHGPPRQGPLGPAAGGAGPRGYRPAGPASNAHGGARSNGPGSRVPRLRGPNTGAQPHNVGVQSSPPNDSNSQSPSRETFRPCRPSPLQCSGPLNALADGPRSPSPPLSPPGIDELRLHSPTAGSPPSPESPTAMYYPEPELPPSEGRKTPGQEKQDIAPLISTLASPSTVTSPSGSIRRLSLDDGPIEQFSRPIIQNVRAKRDTLALKTPRRQSLSMKIEELEKTLISAQQAHQTLKPQSPVTNRVSAASSVYSDGVKDDDDHDGPILPIQPAPLRVPPPLAPRPAVAHSSVVPEAVSPPTPTLPAAPPIPAFAANRPQSPFGGPPKRGVGPRRPALEEYSISSNQVVKPHGGTPSPASRSGSTDNYSTHSSPPSRTDTPQLRHPNWRRDMNQPSPAPTVETFEHPHPSLMVVDTGFNFDFGPTPGPGVGAPPTPDSTTWPLMSPTNAEPSSSLSVPPPAPDPLLKTEGPSKFTRAHVPPPLNLKFNFSPDAPSRDPNMASHAGLWTPPIRSTPFAGKTADGRPSTSSGPSGNGSGGNKLAASPRLISQFPESVQRDDDPAAFMGIGMARGPSIKEVRRPKTSGGRGPRQGAGAGAGTRMVDSFGTGFI